MRLTFGDDWHATVTDEPLRATPRFTGDSLALGPWRDRGEHVRFLTGTFGSEAHLWDDPDVLRFAADTGDLAGAEFQLPQVTVPAAQAARVPLAPGVRRGGLRAEEVRDFRHPMCTVLCRAPGDTVLTCLRDLAVLDDPLDARIGIAPDVALLVQHGGVVGWSLTDPVRHVTAGYAAPSFVPPSPATRRLFSECLDLITVPALVDDLVDGEPAALARLRAADDALRTQREDRHRADALREMIATYVTDYAGP
ncbi:hypothetical protein [Streptomyces fragilis]|uniref:Uncharacterized protein n=1 Tax=Streptomyces fragilis TaxID=67301 RepID=A0ABV2YQ11_9ACTN|nr:hypothetical protein [Streptomyces fragilis]